jgi:hypothetical protein
MAATAADHEDCSYPLVTLRLGVAYHQRWPTRAKQLRASRAGFDGDRVLWVASFKSW